MTSAYRKNIIRTIKYSMGRFLAIFAIIALGVSFFAGLKASKPDMIRTGQMYLEEHLFFDLQAISTIGFTEREVEKIAAIDGVISAAGAISLDFLALSSATDAQEEFVLRVYSITEDVNLLDLVEGEMPSAPNEALLDYAYFDSSMIGQQITVSSANTEDTIQNFAYKTYTITGLTRSPLYLNRERGTTNIGNGRIFGFLFIPRDGFAMEYATQVFLRMDVAEAAFTKAYDDAIAPYIKPMEQSLLDIVQERFQDEIDKARAELESARQELADKKVSTQAELDDAKTSIEDGLLAIAEGRQKLEEARLSLTEKEQELTDAKTALQEGVDQYNQGVADYQVGVNQYNEGVSQYLESRAQLRAQQDALNQQRAQYEAFLAAGGAPDAAIEAQLQQGQNQINTANAQLDQVNTQLQATLTQLEQARVALEVTNEKLNTSQIQLNDGINAFNEGKQALTEQEHTLNEKEQELKDAQAKYEEGLATFQREIADAETKIREGEDALSILEDPRVFVLGRNTNVGYAFFESDIGIVESVAVVFPIFFFLIAALVCSTTMTRMVDVEHNQMGTFRALGYTKSAILSKYLIYSMTAATLGCVFGFMVGISVFPTTIWAAYSALYGFADLVHETDYVILVLCLVVSLLCSGGMAFFAARLKLVHSPAEMIRPQAPKQGKRIWLERLTPVWSRMPFLYKVTSRNIFRFKKRLFMMIIGISGCMALVLAGFGLRDSISDIIPIQYTEILNFDLSATFTRSIPDHLIESMQSKFENDIQEYSLFMQTGVDLPLEVGSKSVSLLVDEQEEVRKTVQFHYNGLPVSSPADGEVLLDVRLMRVGNFRVGDMVTFRSGDVESQPLRVAGFFNNYVLFYAYMNAATYQQAFVSTYEKNTLFIRVNEGVDEYAIATWLSDQSHVGNVQVVRDLKNQVGSMLESLNYIVGLIIGCAGALAFIVLFNLGNINISERQREIATLKVLGFYSREAASYVFRENFILSLIGMVLGIPVGIIFHNFIIGQIHIDMLSFQAIINPLSFGLSLLVVFAFSLIVDVILRMKLEKIDMAESLKSVE